MRHITLLAVLLCSLAIAASASPPQLCPDTSSSASVYVCSTTPSWTPVAGDTVWFSAINQANSGITTLNVNGLGAKTVKKQGASNLTAGDLQTAGTVLLIYDGTYWQMASGTLGDFAAPPPIGTVPNIIAGTTITGQAAIASTPLQSSTIALVTSGAAYNGVNPVTLNTTGATLLVAVLSTYDPGPATIADGKSNSWHYLTQKDAAGGHIRIAYAYSVSVGSGHTFTVTGTSPYEWAMVYAFSGTITGSTVYDVSNGEQAGTSPITMASITPAAGDVVITGLVYAGTLATASIDSGFTTANVLNTGQVYNGATSYLLGASGATLAPIFTLSGSAPQAGVIASFKVAPAAHYNPVSGCSLASPVGGAWAGSFASGTTGTCTVTITPGITAPNGWTCDVHDLTTPADVVNQTASSTTTATISGTTISGDVITWKCVAF